MIKEIIFDCFGVLTQDGWIGFLKKYATDENIEELRYANHQADSGLMDYEELLDEIVRLSGVEREIAHKMITVELMINDDVIEIVRKLKMHYKIGLISNVGRPIEVYLPKDITDLFEVQTLSYQVGMIKPAKEIFDAHLVKSGVEPGEAIFIDDREPNVEGARSAGLRAIHFKSADQLKSELEKLGVKV